MAKCSSLKMARRFASIVPLPWPSDDHPLSRRRHERFESIAADIRYATLLAYAISGTLT